MVARKYSVILLLLGICILTISLIVVLKVIQQKVFNKYLKYHVKFHYVSDLEVGSKVYLDGNIVGDEDENVGGNK